MNHTPAFRFPHPLAHSIPADYTDPAGFVGPSYYPVLQDNTDTDEVRLHCTYYAAISIAQQDGIWVHGLHWQTNTNGLGFSPGRKWGEFPDALTATLYAWERIAHDLHHRHSDPRYPPTKLMTALLDQVRQKAAKLLLASGLHPPSIWSSSNQLELFR
jgi:hypothetical protein